MKIIEDIKAKIANLEAEAQAEVNSLLAKLKASVYVRMVACAAIGYALGYLVAKFVH